MAPVSGSTNGDAIITFVGKGFPLSFDPIRKNIEVKFGD